LSSPAKMFFRQTQTRESGVPPGERSRFTLRRKIHRYPLVQFQSSSRVLHRSPRGSRFAVVSVSVSVPREPADMARSIDAYLRGEAPQLIAACWTSASAPTCDSCSSCLRPVFLRDGGVRHHPLSLRRRNASAPQPRPLIYARQSCRRMWTRHRPLAAEKMAHVCTLREFGSAGRRKSSAVPASCAQNRGKAANQTTPEAPRNQL
jgi:hypothetical protein